MAHSVPLREQRLLVRRVWVFSFGKMKLPEINERIRAQKDKTLAKHFTAFVDGQKVKIANYRFKTSRSGRDTVLMVELITKIKFDVEMDKKLSVEIPSDAGMLTIKCQWHHGMHSPGNYWQVFAVDEVLEERQPNHQRIESTGARVGGP
jgi:hypothetical protein